MSVDGAALSFIRPPGGHRFYQTLSAWRGLPVGEKPPTAQPTHGVRIYPFSVADLTVGAVPGLGTHRRADHRSTAALATVYRRANSQHYSRRDRRGVMAVICCLFSGVLILIRMFCNLLT